MVTAPDIKVDQQIAELVRERNMLHRVYPSLIAKGKIKPAEAQYANQCLEAAIRSLEYLRDNRDFIVGAVKAARANTSGGSVSS